MGKKIGSYTLGTTLGRGHFSKVKLGTDCNTGAHVAVKIIEKLQLTKEHMEEQLRREVALMRLLEHPNVIKLIEVMQTSNNIYLILELVKGGELFDKVVKCHRFNEVTGCRYFKQLIDGLSYCHDQGVAHRDLKPENLLVDENDNLKISDFGLANLQKTGQLRTVCGTPNYVAPEVLKEKGYNGPQADIWSCGVILYVMLTGHLPFDDPSLEALFNKIERGIFSMPQFLTNEAKDLLVRLLTVDPNQRITMAQLFNHPWLLKNLETLEKQMPNSPLVRRSSSKKNSINALSALDPSQIAELTQSGGGGEGSSNPISLADSISQTLSPQQLAAAISSTTETKLDRSVNTSNLMQLSDKVMPVQRPGMQNEGVDAFDLISRLTGGELNPLVCGNHRQMAVIKAGKIFLYRGTKEEMIALLQSLKASPKETHERKGEIKGYVSLADGGGVLSFGLTLIETCASSNLFLVEVKRTRGDIYKFYDFCASLLAALGPKLRSQELLQGQFLASPDALMQSSQSIDNVPQQ